MPGIVAIFSPSVQEKKLNKEGKTISRSLFRSDELVSNSFSDDNLHLQINKLPSQSGGILEINTLVLGWVGNLWYRQNRLSAETLPAVSNALNKEPLEIMFSAFEGQYQLIIYERQNRNLYVASDKVSSYPFYYCHNKEKTVITPEIFSFGPSIKRDAGVRTGAIYEFLMSGHLWGDGTFLEGVSRLGPGRFLAIDNSGLKENSYFSFSFEEKVQNKSKKERARHLYEAVHADLDKLPKTNTILTLSGGLDSRALLGFLRERKMDFDTVSYSFGESLSDFSDTGIAREIAEKYKLNFELYRAGLDDADKIIKNINGVIQATGGESDVVAAQDALLGQDFYESLGTRYQTLLRGDEVWGWGDYALSRDMAFIENFLFTPGELPVGRKLLELDARQDATATLEKHRENFSLNYLSKSGNNDLKDYIYWRHREARLLQNMAYYRRCYIDQQAPFLYDNTLQGIRQVPGKNRIRKKHFVDMAKTYFPDLFRDQKQATAYKNTKDKYSLLYENEQFVTYMKRNLVIDPPRIFQDLINMDELKNMFERVINAEKTGNTQKNEYNTKRFFNNALRKSAYLPGLVKYGLKKAGKFHFPIPERTYLYRLFILALALKRYEKT